MIDTGYQPSEVNLNCYVFMDHTVQDLCPLLTRFCLYLIASFSLLRCILSPCWNIYGYI